MTSKGSEDSNTEMELEWIQLRQEIESQHVTSLREESARERFSRKFHQNPFVPIGCLATAGALSYGLWSFRTGQRRMSQIMMRFRIAAQGFTIVALLVGIGMSALKK